MKKRFRKKGSIILLTLLMIMGIFLISAIFINLSFAYEVMNRMQNAADMGARVRAQAVDIALKERYGYIESLHDGSSGYPGDNVPDRYTLSETEDGYVNNLYSPVNNKYLNAKLDANDLTKDAIVEYLNANVGINTDGEKQVDIQRENICISVRPLPSGTTATMNFSCSATVGTQTVLIEATDVDVNGLDHQINKGPDGMNVMNVVFVGIAYEHKHFIYTGVQRVLHGDNQADWDAPPVRTAWSTAYPQIDACTANNACE